MPKKKMTPDEAREAIRRVMEEHPALGVSGFGKNDMPLTPDDRLRMLDERSVDEFIRSCRFIDACERYKTNRGHSSYGLKHDAESKAGGYIANGMFLAAALHLKVRVVERCGPNLVLGLYQPKDMFVRLK